MQIDQPEPAAAKHPLAYDIPTGAKVANTSRSEIYEAMKRGALKAKKNGRRTIILHDDLMAYLASLPDYQAAA